MRGATTFGCGQGSSHKLGRALRLHAWRVFEKAHGPGFLIAAAGTGGHLFLPLGRGRGALPAEFLRLQWLGEVPDRPGAEAGAGAATPCIPFAPGLTGAGGWRNSGNCSKTAGGQPRGAQLIRRLKAANVVFSTGGYIAAPAYWRRAVWWLLFWHELPMRSPGQVTGLAGAAVQRVAWAFRLHRAPVSPAVARCWTRHAGRQDFLLPCPVTGVGSRWRGSAASSDGAAARGARADRMVRSPWLPQLWLLAAGRASHPAPAIRR